MKYMRNICGKTSRYQTRNELIMNVCGVELRLTGSMDLIKWEWFGHVERMTNARIVKRICEIRMDKDMLL